MSVSGLKTKTGKQLTGTRPFDQLTKIMQFMQFMQIMQIMQLEKYAN
jgi:hypothetical protein